jgi:virulence-associated protein E
VLGVTMPPAGARFHGSLPKLGAPIHTAEYADGFKICAYLEPADPAIGVPEHRRYMPWQWAPDRQEFAQRALPDQPRPLYRPENLEHYPDAPVYVFEREDMADAFNALSGDEQVVGTTCAGGSGAFELGDWGELYTREVILWPTNCVPCQQAMHSLARTLEKAGARVSLIAIPQDKPDEWNFNDVTAAAWSWEQVERFVRDNRKKVDAQLLPIPRASANGAAPPVELPTKRVRQPPEQIRTARDVWSQIPNLRRAGNDTPYGHVANIVQAMMHFSGRFADIWYDEFHCKIFTDTQNPREWTAVDDTQLCVSLQHELHLSGVRTSYVTEAVELVAHQTPRNEVKEWLLSLKWDGKPRLAGMLYAAWGAEANPYTTSVGRCFLVGAVARIMRPGCQVDYVPVLEGPGGRGKTSSLRVLFGKWFDNPTSYMGEKDFLQNMNGKWCLELAELANIKGRALETVKATITRTIDTYRTSYGRKPGTYPRQCVFAGTTDRSGWNADEAGGRRWWPVKCTDIDIEWIKDCREQLFAEAVQRFKDAESWWDVPERAARAEQAARQTGDAWAGRVRRYLAKSTTVPDLEDVFTFALDMEEPKDWSEGNYARLRRLMLRLNWVEKADGSWTPCGSA